MAFFPHKNKGNPAIIDEFLEYSIECGKQHDYLSALFYCYWALETIRKDREKIKKKEHVDADDLAVNFVTRAAELRFKYKQHPVASMMKNPEIEIMQRRIQDVKTLIQEMGTLVPASDEEASKLGLKLKDLAEEGSFLDELFSPFGQVEGPEMWQERLAAGVEQLFTNLSRVQAVAAAEAAEARRKAELKASEARMEAETKEAEARMKEEEARRRVEAKEAEVRMKEEARQAAEAQATKTRMIEEALKRSEKEKSELGIKRWDDLKIEDPPTNAG